MKKQTGVWIDTKKAKIVTLTGERKDLKTIHSDIETRERVAGESNQPGRFGEQYLDDEKAKAQKIQNQSKDFFKTILNEVADCESLVVFGPANMKHELEKEIKKDLLLSSKLKGVETADSMTDNQISAWVVGYYEKTI